MAHNRREWKEQMKKFVMARPMALRAAMGPQERIYSHVLITQMSELSQCRENEIAKK